MRVRLLICHWNRNEDFLMSTKVCDRKRQGRLSASVPLRELYGEISNFMEEFRVSSEQPNVATYYQYQKYQSLHKIIYFMVSFM